MRVLVTGGSGFIGTAITARLLRQGAQVLNVEGAGLGSSPEALVGWMGSRRYRILKADICDIDAMLALFEEFQPDLVLNCAAENEVERSPSGATGYLRTNFLGTYTLLEAARYWWAGRRGGYRFHQVSTDEVYGGLALGEPEIKDPVTAAPRTSFVASKALADHLVHAWGHAYNLPVVVTQCADNYGPWQFPEKLIPSMITNGIEGQALALAGSGENVRGWVHVSDHADAVARVVEHGQSGETYRIDGAQQQRNKEVIHQICKRLDERIPDAAPHHRMISQGIDRPVPRQYLEAASEKAARQLGWRPNVDFREGLTSTVDWYLENKSWWRRLRGTQQPKKERELETA